MSVFCTAAAELVNELAFLTETVDELDTTAGLVFVFIDDDDVKSIDGFLICGGGGSGTLVRCATVWTVRGRELGGGLTRLVVFDVLVVVVVVVVVVGVGLDFFICDAC